MPPGGVMGFFSWRGLLGWGSGFALTLFWGLVVLRIISVSDNHIGVNLLWATPLFAAAVLAGGLWWSASRRLAGAALVTLGVLSLGCVILLDRLDILVEYESWLERGMPERPF